MVCGQLMVRPKSSAIGLLDTGLDIYSANKLRKMGSEFDSLRRNHEISTAITLDAISGIAELQTATMYGITQLSEQLTELSKISWSIANYFERKEAKEDFIGDLKMVLIKFEEELDYIDKISEEYTEYATLQVQSLQSLVKKNDVRIEHFKTLSFADIDKAKGILERIERTHTILRNKLLEEGGGMGIKELKHLEESLYEIPQKKLLLESLEKELTNSLSKNEKDFGKHISTEVIEEYQQELKEVKFLKAKIKANDSNYLDALEKMKNIDNENLNSGIRPNKTYSVWDKYRLFSLGFTFCWISLILFLNQYFSNIVAPWMVLLLGFTGILSVNFILWLLRGSEMESESINRQPGYFLEFELEQLRRRDIYLRAESTDAARRLSGIENAKSDLERNLKSISNIEQKIQDLRIEIQETYESIKHLIPYSNYV